MSALLRNLVTSLPASFPDLAVGDETSLFYIDELTDDEGETFTARVVGARSEGGVDFVEFTAHLTDKRLQTLSWCLDQKQCFLHFEFTLRHGAFSTSRDFGVLLKILSISASHAGTQFHLVTRVL